ncbi:MAG: hypothetical protein AABX11_07790 [Nanoarchaeota archaeon]
MQQIDKELKQRVLNQSRFRKSISFLRNNQHLGTEAFTPGYQSNCFGTVAFVLKIEREIESNWRRLNPDGGLRDAMGNYCILALPSLQRPSYIGELPFSEFIKDESFCTRVEEYGARDRIITFSYVCNNTEACGYHLRHAGIYLGEGLFFEQRNKGEEFGVNSVDLWINSLSKNCVRPINVEYFRLNPR